MTTIDTLMAMAQAMAVASIGKPDAVALVEARAALLTALQENDDTIKRLVRELRYIEDISRGQVKRVASSALESVRSIDTSPERVEKSGEGVQVGCTSNCDNCTYAHGSPAHAGYCYMFYDEPNGVCAKWKDANPSHTVIGWATQPAREPLTEDQIFDMYLEPRSNKDIIELARAIERAHGIGGDK